MNFIAYLFLRFFAFLFSLIPMKIIYLISDGIAFLLHDIIKYRRKVVQSNLKNAFPEKSEVEIQRIQKKFYKNLSDIILEGIKGLSMSKSNLEKRFKYLNVDIVNQEFEKGKSAIVVASHLANWEWGVLSFNFWTKAQVIGVYKPLNNKFVDTYYNNKRKKFGLELTSMAQTGRIIIKRKNDPTVFVFIADQTPSDVQNAHWFEFLNQDTPFLHGVDKIAKKTGYPIFNTDIKRVGRGQYEITFKKLVDDPGNLNEQEVTRLYASELERIIKERPESWLWSHRRWKRKRGV